MGNKLRLYIRLVRRVGLRKTLWTALWEFTVWTWRPDDPNIGWPTLFPPGFKWTHHITKTQNYVTVKKIKS